MDDSGYGKIHRHQMKAGLEAIGVDMDHEHVNTMTEELYADHDGECDFDEFQTSQASIEFGSINEGTGFKDHLAELMRSVSFGESITLSETPDTLSSINFHSNNFPEDL